MKFGAYSCRQASFNYLISHTIPKTPQVSIIIDISKCTHNNGKKQETFQNEILLSIK